LAPDVGVGPFLRWPGGKRWLVPKLTQLLPAVTGKYIEPFLGSGALFFQRAPDRACLSDSNEELIQTYEAIRDDWREVVRRLRIHQRLHSTEYYYAQRSAIPTKPAERAARFIYLNRTCWNGVYRVNRKGEFNVPIGTKRNVILPTDDFESVADRLRSAVLRAEDFSTCIARAGDGGDTVNLGGWASLRLFAYAADSSTRIPSLNSRPA